MPTATFTPLFYKHFPALKKKWSGEVEVLGPAPSSPFGPARLVRNSAGDVIAVQTRYLQMANPRLYYVPKSPAEAYVELVTQLGEWMYYHVAKPGPTLRLFFENLKLGPTVKGLGPNDREYLVVEYDLLQTIIEQARNAGLTAKQMSAVVDRITTEIIPFLSGDPGEWWLGYMLPVLAEKGVINQSIVEKARRAWARLLRQ